MDPNLKLVQFKMETSLLLPRGEPDNDKKMILVNQFASDYPREVKCTQDGIIDLVEQFKYSKMESVHHIFIGLGPFTFKLHLVKNEPREEFELDVIEGAIDKNMKIISKETCNSCKTDKLQSNISKTVDIYNPEVKAGCVNLSQFDHMTISDPIFKKDISYPVMIFKFNYITPFLIVKTTYNTAF